jgi:uncharacterized protein (TIGR00288 family)
MNKEIEPKIALFIDYDNIAIGLREAGAGEFEVGKILDRLLEKGRIIYKRAYADWYLFSDGKRKLHEHAIEMIDIPMRRNIGKNSADIRMVVDALDLCYTKEHIDTFVIGSGDSDFTPLVTKLKENDKEVIGFGLRAATSNLLANACDEFIFLEDLVSVQVSRPHIPSGLTKRQHDAFTMVMDAVAALMRENKDTLWGSLVKDTIRRKRPSFSEGQFGYSSFSQLLEDAAKHGLIGLIKDPKSGGTPVVTGFGQIHEPARDGSRSGTSSTPRSTLTVPNGDSMLLPTTAADEEGTTKEAEKPARRRSTRRTTTRKTSTAKSTGSKAGSVSKAGTKSDSDADAKQADVKEAEKPEDKPKKTTRRTRTTSKTSTSKSKKAEDSKDEKKAVEKPEPKTREADEGKKPASSASKAAKDDNKPKGQPLRTRVRKRKR